MDKLLVLISIAILTLVSCEKEDHPSPSMKDEDRVGQLIDLSKPLVKEYFEKYNCAILYDFNDETDIRFNLGDVKERQIWQNLRIEKIVRQTAVDSALHVLDSAVLSNFKDEITFKDTTYKSDFKRKYFPNKIIIADKLINENKDWMNIIQTESQSSFGGIGALHSVGNNNAFIFNLDLQTMLSSSQTYNSFRNDDIYIFLCHMIEKHKLYDLIPDEFYAYSSNYYGKTIATVQKENGQTPADINNAEYVAYGFCLKKGGGYGFNKELPFPTREMDVRQYINETIHPYFASGMEPTNAKLKLITKTLMSWGIDVAAINKANADLFEDE